MSLLTHLESAPAIGLTDLVADAAMLTRVDRKYRLTSADADAIADALPAEMAVLTIDGQHSFGYRSTYFDSPDLDAYLGAGRGRRRRFKVRTREYLDSGTCWLEVKTRGPRGTTVKQRIAHDSSDVLDAEFIAQIFADHHIEVDATELTPVLRTDYRRMTIHVPGDVGRPATRATIDSDLAWTDLPDEVRLELPNLVVVETKGYPAPSDLDRVLWRHGHRPDRISKFGLGLAVLRPDLPELKWRRSIDTALAA